MIFAFFLITQNILYIYIYWIVAFLRYDTITEHYNQH